MALVKCPNCGSTDTAAAVGDVHHCLGCGRAFNSKGDMVSGPDQETKDIITARLADKQPHVVGNLADLQRLGAENAPDPAEPEFVLPPGAEDAVPASEQPDSGVAEQNTADDDKGSAKASSTSSKK